jgi:iron complex transport system ATP-binding protein
MTIEDLVSLGRHPYQRWFRQWSTADRDATAAAMSACGVGELRSRRADAVSGGQLQRARLAAALAQDTEFLALDEPTSFLDVRHQEETLSLARRINAQHDRTLLMVLHDVVHAARYTDYLIVLAAGRVVAAGAPTDVLTPTLVREVFGVDAALAYAGSDEVGLLLPLV